VGQLAFWRNVEPGGFVTVGFGRQIVPAPSLLGVIGYWYWRGFGWSVFDMNVF